MTKKKQKQINKTKIKKHSSKSKAKQTSVVSAKPTVSPDKKQDAKQEQSKTELQQLAANPVLHSPKTWLSLLLIVICGTLIGLMINSYIRHDGSVTNQTWSKQQQTSLIKTETKAVKHNAKPNDVVGTLLKRQRNLSSHNQKLSSDLMYTSIQNATLYYNNAAYIMGGEVDYSRPGKSKNSLDASKSNAWVQGFLAEIERQHLVAYNYSASQILILPDFTYLDQNVSKNSSKELQIFLNSASKVQKMKVFTKNEVNMVEAANAYQEIMLGSLKLAKVNTNSKYLQDFASLARIYHDLALGFAKDNNLTKKGEKYRYSTDSVSALHIIANNKKQLLANDARKVLNQLDTKTNTVSTAYLNQAANNSAKVFGTSVYWQNQTDISTMLNGGK